jgi:hypothetical protein
MTKQERWDKFNKDLNEKGLLGERTLAEYFSKNLNYKILGYNNDKLWDFTLGKGNVKYTFEVKTDRWEYFHDKKTNNIFVEVRDTERNCPTGLYATEANIMAFFFPDDEECFLISTTELKNLLRNQPNLFIRKTNCGDGGSVTAYVINRVENRHLFKVVNVPKDDRWINK